MGKVRDRGGVCLTSYGMIGSNTSDFIGENGFQWDYVILDEGVSLVALSSFKIS